MSSLTTVVKGPKCCHVTPILRSLHWLRITERIEYKLLSLTYKILTTYLFVNLILVPVPAFTTHLILHPSLLPFLIHHSSHRLLPLSLTAGIKPACFTNPTPVVSLLLGLPLRTIVWNVSFELLDF